jgi:hypothetical protein
MPDFGVSIPIRSGVSFARAGAGKLATNEEEVAAAIPETNSRREIFMDKPLSSDLL